MLMTMMMMNLKLSLLLILLTILTGVVRNDDEITTEINENFIDCQDECDPQSCQAPNSECLAGIVKDHCDCCYECARREGQRCYEESFMDQLPDGYPKYPKCGDDLICRLRTDLEPTDKPEAICYCTQNEPICGSDGVTYENQCQFTEARYRNRKLFEVDNQPCKSAPKITSPPEDTTNNTGSSVSLSCEAWGWPIPSIEWKTERDGTELSIQIDDRFEIKSNQSTNYAIISWLQIMDTHREDSGNYICIASNSEGDDKATAYLTIGNFQKRFDLIEE